MKKSEVIYKELIDVFNRSLYSGDAVYASYVCHYLKESLVQDIIHKDANREFRYERLYRIFMTLGSESFTNLVLCSDIVSELEHGTIQLLSENDPVVSDYGKRLYRRLINDALFSLRGAPNSFEIFFAKRILREQGFIYQAIAKSIKDGTNKKTLSLYDIYKNVLSHILMNDNWDLVMSAAQNHFYIGCLFSENRAKEVPIDLYLENTYTSLTLFLTRIKEERKQFGLQRVAEEVINLITSGIFVYHKTMLRGTKKNFMTHLIDILDDIIDLPPKYTMRIVLNNRLRELMNYLSNFQPSDEEVYDFGRIIEKATQVAFKSLSVTSDNMKFHTESNLHDFAIISRYAIGVKDKQFKIITFRILLEFIDDYLKQSERYRKNLPKTEIRRLVLTTGLYAYLIGEHDLAKTIGKKLNAAFGQTNIQINIPDTEFLLQEGFKLQTTPELKKEIEKFNKLAIS